MAESVTITIPSGTVTDDLSGFPVMVRLSDLPAGFWSSVKSDGGDIRVKTTGGSSVAMDLARFDYYDQDGVLFFLAGAIPDNADSEWEIHFDSALDLLPHDNTYGRNAVWAAYDSVIHLGVNREDRTGKGDVGIMSTTSGEDGPQLHEKLAETADLDHHQGVAYGNSYYFVVGTNKITKYNTSWSQIDQNTDPIGDTSIASVNHLGDPEYHNGYLYIPLEVYPNSPYDNQHVVVFDASDLSFVTSYDISAQGMEVSGCCYNPVDGLFYVCSYITDGYLYKYDPDDSFAYKGTLTVPTAHEQKQGIVFWKNYFWVTSDYDTSDNRVFCLGLDGAGYATTIKIEATGVIEGITKKDDTLVFLFDTGDTETIQTWKPYDEELCAGGGAAFKGFGELRYSSRPSRTTFTLGVSLAIDSKVQNRSALSYWDLSAGDTNTRATLAYSTSQGSLGIWDSNNSWLLPSPVIDPTLDQAYRLNAVYSGTTSRKLFVGGALKNTETSISAVPAALDCLRIGSEDLSRNERFSGIIGYVYLHPAALSADWIAAEYLNVSAPSSFYSISGVSGDEVTGSMMFLAM